MMEGYTEAIKLDAAGIDKISKVCTEWLAEGKAEKETVISLRLMVEELMLIWQERLGAKIQCNVKCIRRFGNIRILVEAKGEKIGLEELKNTELGSIYSNQLLKDYLPLGYSYNNGTNTLTINIKGKRKLSDNKKIVIAVILAALMAVVFHFLPESWSLIAQEYAAPLQNKLIVLIKTVATLMIFFSVLTSIVSIGNLSDLSKMGKTLLKRSGTRGFLISVATLLLVAWLFPVSFESNSSMGTSGIRDIYNMLLDMIPENLFTPFIEGNILQAFLMSILLGIVILTLNEYVSTVQELVFQLNRMSTELMSIVFKVMPFIIFFCVFSLFINDEVLKNIGILAKSTVVTHVVCFFFMILYLACTTARMELKFKELVKTIWPAFFIGLTTASSVLSLSEMVKTGKEKMGIVPSFCDFGVPLIHVLFRPGIAIRYLIVSLSMAEIHGVVINFQWLVTVALVCTLLSIATPPTSGGGIACYAVMFEILGIPAEAIAIAGLLEMIADYISTSTTIAMQQAELLLSAEKMNMVDKEVLKGNKTV